MSRIRIKNAVEQMDSAARIKELELRLQRIHDIVDVAEQRCLAADGPVSRAQDEISDWELREIYRLSEPPTNSQQQT